MGTDATKGHTAEPHMNVTPLIDVLLVLLIIFMVVSPLSPPGLWRESPQNHIRTYRSTQTSKRCWLPSNRIAR